MKMIVAYDGTEGARRAARESLPVAHASNAELVLLHVLNPLVDAASVQAPSTEEAIRQVAATAEAEARAFIDELYEGAEVQVALQQRSEDAGEAIARLAEEQDGDMIVIATRRAGGLSGFFLGSVTQQVIRCSRLPVMVVQA